MRFPVISRRCIKPEDAIADAAECLRLGLQTRRARPKSFLRRPPRARKRPSEPSCCSSRRRVKRLCGAPERCPGPEGTPCMCPGAVPGAGHRSGVPRCGALGRRAPPACAPERCLWLGTALGCPGAVPLGRRAPSACSMHHLAAS